MESNNENNINSQNNETTELQKKNKILTYALIGVGALLIGGAIFYFVNGKKEVTTTTPEKIDSSKYFQPKVASDSVKVDSASTKASTNSDSEYDEEGYEPYSEYFVIANEAYIRNSPSETSEVSSSKLKFGDRVWVDNSYQGGKYSKIYFAQPSKSNPQTAYYVADYVVTYESDFEEFKKYFSLKPFAGLATKTKKLIMANDYSESRSYNLTQNLDRSKSAICYGDFDSDGLQDVAVVLDNNESQYSRLLVICTNAATKDPYLAYAENYSDKMRINSFKKGASVYMDSSSLVSSPSDGVILVAEDAKIGLIYDRQNQKFRTYYQSASSYDFE